MIGLKRFTLLLISILPVSSLPLASNQDAIAGKFIVTLKPGLPSTQVNNHLAWVADVHARSLSRRDTTGVNKIYTINDFKGYSGSFDQATISQIQDNENVAAIEPVQHVTTTSLSTQFNAPWGLGSISHTTPNFTEYLYDSAAGEGTYAYVIDTGMNAAHVEFEGRASLGYNAYPDSEFVDRQGHGTHTAGTIASRAYGVAKKAQVVSVKVFDWSGSTTEIVLDGYVWAVNNILSLNRTATSVISMSIGGPYSAAFNAAIGAAFESDIVTVVAAGNSYDDASNYSPASAPEAITVGATDVDNVKADFSNYGSVLDVFAPGVNVLSCWIGEGNDESEWLDGTSMATPHVAGLVLYLKSVEGVTLRGARETVERVRGLATKGVVTQEGEGSPNLLAYNGVGA